MELLDVALVGLVYKLLPGFVAAWIFYGLTTHPKPTAFERVVQALIFTAFTQFVVIPLREVALLIGRHWFALAAWTEDTGLVVGMIVAIGFGLIFSYLANTSRLHEWLFERGITRKTSYSSEWYGAFHRRDLFVYLHLKNGRRIWGWPESFPDQPGCGHFVLQHPEWILKNNTRIPLVLTDSVVISATDVDWVEFEKREDDWTFDRQQQLADAQKLIDLQTGADENGEGNREEPDGGLQRPSTDAEGRLCEGGEPAQNGHAVGAAADITTTATTSEEVSTP